MGKDMFVMRHIGKCELALGANLVAILVYNKMHACIFLKTHISLQPNFYLIGFLNYKVKAYILRFKICFLNFGFGFKLSFSMF